MMVAWHEVPGKGDRADPSRRERYDLVRHGPDFLARDRLVSFTRACLYPKLELQTFHTVSLRDGSRSLR
jgi:hypothetical protein